MSVTLRVGSETSPWPPGRSTGQEGDQGSLCLNSCPPESGRVCAAPGSQRGRTFCRRRYRRRAGSRCGSGGRALQAHEGWRTPRGRGAECGPAVGCRGRLAGALWPPHLCARLQACISMEPEEHWTADSAGICCVSWEGPFPSLSVTQFPVYKMGLEEASTQPL